MNNTPLAQNICNQVRCEAEGVKETGFPIEVFPSAIQELLLDLSKYENYNIEYAAASLISAAATAIGNSRAIVIKGQWVNAPALYMILVGRAGLGKTPPMSFAYQPLRDIDAENLDRYTAEMKTYNQSKGKKGDDADSLDMPVLVKTIISDFTPEAMLATHHDNLRSIGIVTDEILSLFKSVKRYSGSSIIIEIYLTAYSGQPLDCIRKSDRMPIYIKHPCIGIIGSVQTNLVSDICNKEYISNGLIDRILFVFPNNQKASRWIESDDTNIRTDMGDRWKKIVNKLFSLECPMDVSGTSVEPVRLKMSPDAVHYFYQWYNNIVDEVNAIDDESLIESRKMKLNSNAARLALVLQLLRWATGESHKDFVDLESVKGGIVLTGYFEDCYRRVMIAAENADIGEEKEAWLETLPQNFTSGEAVSIGSKFGIARRTMFDILKRMLNEKPARIKKNAHGKYEKVQSEIENAPCTTALSHLDIALNTERKCNSAEVQSADEIESRTLIPNDKNHE